MHTLLNIHLLSDFLQWNLAFSKVPLYLSSTPSGSCNHFDSLSASVCVRPCLYTESVSDSERDNNYWWLKAANFAFFSMWQSRLLTVTMITHNPNKKNEAFLPQPIWEWEICICVLGSSLLSCWAFWWCMQLLWTLPLDDGTAWILAQSGLHHDALWRAGTGRGCWAWIRMSILLLVTKNCAVLTLSTGEIWLMSGWMYLSS